jgi:hypothetical protein
MKVLAQRKLALREKRFVGTGRGKRLRDIEVDTGSDQAGTGRDRRGCEQHHQKAAVFLRLHRSVS